MPEQGTLTGRYLYCVIRGDEPRTFDAQGIDSNGGRVCTIHAAGLAAVVSDSEIVDYQRSRRNMIVHTLVQEEVMRDYTILPVRFGTVAPDAESVREKLLSKRCQEFNSLLDEMTDRVELGLKAFWREDVLFQEIVDANPQIRRLRDSLAGKSEAQSRYERIHLGELVAAAVKQKRDVDAERILSHLQSHIYKSRTNCMLADRMVLNAAFLVDRNRADDFDKAVADLDSGMGHRCTFKYIGPVPPYNFVNIVIHWDR
jgi:hypothetical protein